MFKSGIAYMLCFLVSLIVGHALIILLCAYAPPVCTFFVAVGEAIDNIFGVAYSHREIAAFTLATIVAFPLGILFHLFLKVGR
jgi:hypothetical protein